MNIGYFDYDDLALQPPEEPDCGECRWCGEAFPVELLEDYEGYCQPCWEKHEEPLWTKEAYDKSVQVILEGIKKVRPIENPQSR